MILNVKYHVVELRKVLVFLFKTKDVRYLYRIFLDLALVHQHITTTRRLGNQYISTVLYDNWWSKSMQHFLSIHFKKTNHYFSCQNIFGLVEHHSG